MKCGNCGHDCLPVSGTVRESDPRIGEYEIQNAEYFECISCNERSYPVETARRLDRERREVLSNLIGRRPIGAFMSAAAAADLLGVSRQALHKHRRIRKGFIYQTELSGKTVYLRESVELFKKTGDGRFSLHSSGVYEQNQTESVPVVSPVSRLTCKLEGVFCEPETWKWFASATDAAMRPILNFGARKAEPKYSVTPNQPTSVREREDVEYA